MATFYIEDILRDFGDLEPLGYDETFDNDNDCGYVKSWFVRLAYNHRYDEDGGTATPIIEFYSMDTGQFVADYFVDTFLGLDQWGNGYGAAMYLNGDVDAWTITAQDADEIREWCEDALYEIGDPYPFLDR